MISHNDDCVFYMLEHGADVNVVGNCEYCPLHWAVQRDETQIAEALINHGADVNPRNRSGKTPLALARNPEMRRMLISHGAIE